jgi:protein-disulfide isomerase
LFDVAHITRAIADDRQHSLPPDHLDDSDFQTYAKDVGLNVNKFEKCIKEHSMALTVQADQQDGQRFGVNSTPTFFVNGVQTQYPEISDQVKTELEKKKS